VPLTYPTPDDGYVASVQEVTDRLSIEETALTALQRRRVLAAIADSQAGVALALNRDHLLPVRDTKTLLNPVVGVTDFTTWQAWQAHGTTTSTSCPPTLQPDGTYTVVADVGIDARTIPEIRRFVIEDAVESLRNDADAGLGSRTVQSVSAEGQSVSYSDSRGQRQSANPIRAAGTKPRIEDLQRKWKRPLFVTVSKVPQAPWPVDGAYVPRGMTDWR
jgi:hypothetical protein